MPLLAHAKAQGGARTPLVLISAKGNLPALPGGLKSLTVARVVEILQSVNHSKFSEKKAFVEQHPKLMSFSFGQQVPHRLEAEVLS